MVFDQPTIVYNCTKAYKYLRQRIFIVSLSYLSRQLKLYARIIPGVHARAVSRSNIFVFHREIVYQCLIWRSLNALIITDFVMEFYREVRA